MTVAVNGIAHIQLTVNDPDRCIPFWEKLCHFLEMKTLIKGEGVVYCIGSRTGILVRGATPEHRGTGFDQNRAGLHHFCFRARARDDVDAIHRFLVDELDAKIVHPPEEGAFAPGYYSILFEDPDGVRVEVNHVPGRGHLGPGGRLGPGGDGPADRYGSGGMGERELGPMVETTLYYLAPMREKPVYYLHQPPPGTPWRNTRGDRRTVAIHDGRDLAPEPDLDREGFALAPHRTRVDDAWEEDAVRETYYPEVEELVRKATGAARVVAFDHNLRSGAAPERTPQGSESPTSAQAPQTPVRFVHNDYTEASGPQRVRDLLAAEAEDLLQRRFAVINVWKPIRRPVAEAPLAVCDARTIRPGDLVATDLVYEDRKGEVYSLAFSPEHRWFYFPAMQPEEAMLLKCYDSASGRARFTAHTAFDDPSSPEDAPVRESVEVRTLAFFGA